MKTKQTGFAALELLLVVVILAAVGGVGYFVYQKQQNNSTNQVTQESKETNNSLDDTPSAATWQKGDFAVKGSYADADVVQVDDATWRMYYATQPEVKGHNFEVYSATSTDGKTWKTEEGYRKTMATFPDVIKLADGRYRMYYQNAAAIKSAISDDGINFTDESGVRIDKENSENLVFDNVAAPSVTQLADGSYLMVYRGTINERYAQNTPNPTTQLLMWATSTDGLTFSKKGIAIDSRNETLDGQIDGPDLVKWDDDSIRVFFTSYTGVYVATLTNEQFTEPMLAYAGEAKQTDMGFMGAPPGDPTLAKINEQWHMYYGATREDSGIHYATYK